MIEPRIAQNAAESADASASATPSPVIAVSAVALAYAFNTADRQILTVLQEPIAREFALNDSTLGLLGLFFAVGYALASFPLAALTDRGHARTVVVLTFIGWSAMTIACGLATGFLMLAACRIGVAFGESGTAPAGHALIARHLPAHRHGTAMGALMLAAVIGGSLSAGVGSWIADRHGWRAALVAFGLAGLLVAPLVWLGLRNLHGAEGANVAESRVQARAGGPRLVAVAGEFWRQQSLRYMALAGIWTTIAAYGVSQWSASFLMRQHGLSISEAGGIILVALLIGGGTGPLAIGMLADRTGKSDGRAYAATPAAFLALAGTAVVVMVLVPNIPVVCVALGIFQFVVVGVTAPIFAHVQRLANNDSRATASAMVLLLMNSAGQAAGPLLLGVISDVAREFGHTNSLNYAMSAAALMLFIAAASALAAMRTMRADIDASHGSK